MIVVRDVVVGLLVVLVAGVAAERLMRVAGDTLEAPFEVGLETPVLATVMLLRDGADPYSADVYDAMPFSLAMYTPLFQIITSWFPAQVDRPFHGGRLLSLIGLLAALPALLVVGRGRGVMLGVAATAAFLLVWPVTLRAAFMRPDNLAFALSAWAVVVLHERDGRLWRPVLAGVLAALAPAAKQTHVAAPAACLLFLLLTRDRHALVFAMTGALTAGALALAATLAWGRDFWFSILVVPQGAFDVEAAWELFLNMFQQPVFLGVVAAGIVVAAASLAGAVRGRSLRPSSPFGLYALVSWALLMAMIWKSGSSTNYFCEPVFAVLLWLVFRAREQPESRRPAITTVAVLLLAALGALEVSRATQRDYAFVDPALIEKKVGWNKDLRRRAESLAGRNPRVLSPFIASANFAVQDEAYLSDPLLYRLAWDRGVLSPDPLIEVIRDHAFDVVLIPVVMPAALVGSAALERVDQAVREHYRLGYKDPRWEFWIP